MYITAKRKLIDSFKCNHAHKKAKRILIEPILAKGLPKKIYILFCCYLLVKNTYLLYKSHKRYKCGAQSYIRQNHEDNLLRSQPKFPESETLPKYHEHWNLFDKIRKGPCDRQPKTWRFLDSKISTMDRNTFERSLWGTTKPGQSVVEYFGRYSTLFRAFLAARKKTTKRPKRISW